jgi:DUF1680 family protein
MSVSRREFMVGAAACGVAGFAFGGAAASAPAAAGPSREKLYAFRHRDVKLAAGPMKEQFDNAFAFYMKLDEARVLQPYRQLSGLPTDAQPMGGWYDVGAFAPGHSFGQWVSALARFYDATGDAAAKEKVGRLVHGFAECLDGPKSFYDGHRFKGYCYDKHVLALSEAYTLAGIGDAKDILARATDLAVKVLPEKALTREEMRQRPHKDVSYTWDETYTLAENLFLAHEAFGDARYLDMAKRYLHDKPYFEPLSRGENALVGQHAYSHVNALSSAARAYLVLGDEMHLRAIRNAWEMILAQSYATGGWGPNEAFVKPGEGKLAESLDSTHNHFETPCGSYAHFKLARYLARITGESRFGDSLERMLYNGILATKPMREDGSTFYYSDYHPHAQKHYHPDKWPCCSGTYPQVIADYLVSLYFHDGGAGSGAAIYVNAFAPSQVKWGEVTVSQETRYPDEGKVTIRVATPQPKEFTLNVRLPAWADGATIDGAVAAAGTFASVRRTWRDGDQVVVDLPLRYRTEPIDAQHADLVALLRGPVVYVATDGEVKLPAASPEGGAAPVGVASAPFVPLWKVRDEPYTTYVRRG